MRSLYDDVFAALVDATFSISDVNIREPYDESPKEYPLIVVHEIVNLPKTHGTVNGELDTTLAYQLDIQTQNCTDASGNPYYVTGKWTNFAGDIHGVVIVLGDVETPNGNINGASESVLLPQKAWKQYSNDWAFYLAANWDSTAPAAFPGITAPYLSPANQYVTITPTIHGVLYVGGDFTGPTGGGNSDLVYGVIFVKGTVHLNMNSHVKIYYAGDIASDIQWSQPCLYRASWQDTLTPWPTGL